MKATLFSILLAIVLWFTPLDGDLTTTFNLLLLGFPALLLVVFPLVYAASWLPLQKGEQNMTPRLIEMFEGDRTRKMAAAALTLFPLLSIAFFIALNHIGQIDKSILFMIWLILLGGVFDCAQSYLSRLTAYINPFQATQFFKDKAKSNIKQDQLDSLIDNIDALSEMALRALERLNTSLATQTIGELREIGDFLMKSAKGFVILNEETKNREEKHVDKVSYALFYLINRLEMIHEKASYRGLEPLSSQVLSALGRVTISAAHYDLSLVTYPILTLGRAALLALQEKLKEGAIKGQIILLEVAKGILKESDLTYMELKAPFFTLIDNLDKISKEIFKQDKNIPIQTLIQPFLQLKEILNDPRITNHQDYVVIQKEIDRTLAEYSALQAVLSSMPAVSVPDNQ